jgi:glutathione S-transferase
MKVVGTFLSPFVRKVLVVLNLKNIHYSIDPLHPFFGNEKFEKLNFLRKIPVLLDGKDVIHDSSIILQHLEEVYKSTPILPTNAMEKAKHRFIEEYMDSFGSEIIVRGLWRELITKPIVFNQETDKEIVNRLLRNEFPKFCSNLENLIQQLEPDSKDQIQLGEISIGSFFRNCQLAGIEIDQQQFPNISEISKKCFEHDSFKGLRKFEEVCLKIHPLHYVKELNKFNLNIESSLWSSTPKI